jgi:hypothetical protein
MDDNDRKAWVKGARGATAIGAFVARMLDPIARARGFATTALLTEWPAVVGADLARFTSPDKVIWPRRNDDPEGKDRISGWRTEGATLVLKVDGPRAIEVQHQAEQILERVNRYFGYRAIAQLRFLQAPLDRETALPVAQAAPEPIPGSDLPGAEAIDDQGLAAALRRLAAGVKADFTRR